MVENPAALDEVFHALASEPRRRMLNALAEGDRTVGALAGPFEMSLAAVSKHLKALEGAGLVERKPAGRTPRRGGPSCCPASSSAGRRSA